MSSDLSSEQKRDLLKILRDISKECDLEAIAVVSVEGQEIAFFASKETDSIVMSALASALNATGEQAIKQVTFGKLDQVIIKGSDGFLLLQSVDRFILFAASKEIYSLALAMNVLSRYSKTIYQTLV